MSAKAKQKAIADLIMQFADNQDKDSLTVICNKIISEVASIPTPDNFNFFKTLFKFLFKILTFKLIIII